MHDSKLECVCAYMCLCVYVRERERETVCLCMCVYTCVCVYACVCVCVCVWIGVCAFHVCVCVYACIHVCQCMYVLVYGIVFVIVTEQKKQATQLQVSRFCRWRCLWFSSPELETHSVFQLAHVPLCLTEADSLSKLLDFTDTTQSLSKLLDFSGTAQTMHISHIHIQWKLLNFFYQSWHISVLNEVS